MEKQQILEVWHQNYDVYLKDCHRRQEELNTWKKEQLELLLKPTLTELEHSIPEHLRLKVMQVFSFGTEREEKKVCLYSLIVDTTFAPFGVTVLRIPELLDEELEELNAAWKPLVGINVEFRVFYVGSTELSISKKENFMKDLHEAQENAYRTVSEELKKE